MNEKIERIGSDTIAATIDLSNRTLNERIIENNTTDKTPSPNMRWGTLFE